MNGDGGNVLNCSEGSPGLGTQGKYYDAAGEYDAYGRWNFDHDDTCLGEEYLFDDSDN